MSLMNTTERYGSIAKFLHWVIGFLILGMLALGLYMEGLDLTPWKFKLYAFHKSVGISVLFLVVFRIVWTLVNPKPRMLDEKMKGWEAKLAKGVYYFLYFLMIAVPITGWLMNSASGFPTPFFNFFTMPNLMGTSKSMQELFGNAHEILARAFILIFLLHLAGALKHHFVVKDRTLIRMLPFGNK